MAIFTAAVRAFLRPPHFPTPGWTWLAGLSVLTMALGCGAAPHSRPVEQQLAALTTLAANDEQATTASPAERKIIYTANLTLAVKSLSETELQLKRLLAASAGQLAEFREDRAAGARRAARWKVRVTPAQFHTFVDQVADLGVAEVREVNSADVTEEFIDIEARLKNKLQLEARILKLLEEKAGELKDVITVESELARVREEIERIEGRLRYLASQIDLSTVTILACEKEDYLPPTAPTFGERVAAAWFHSLHELRICSQEIVIASVALAPWLVLLLLFCTVGWFVLSRLVRWRVSPPTSAIR